MKGLEKDILIEILMLKNKKVYFDKDLQNIFDKFGDDYFYSREDECFELCAKNTLLSGGNDINKNNDTAI